MLHPNCTNKLLISFALVSAMFTSATFAGPGGMTCASAEPLVEDPWMVYAGDTTGYQDNTSWYGSIVAPGNDAYYTFTTLTPIQGYLTLEAQYDAVIFLTGDCGFQVNNWYDATSAYPGVPGYMTFEDASGNPLPAGTYYLIVTGNPSTTSGIVNGPFSFSIYYQLIYADGFDP